MAWDGVFVCPVTKKRIGRFIPEEWFVAPRRFRCPKCRKVHRIDRVPFEFIIRLVGE